MQIAIFFGHPSHFYLFESVIDHLRQNGHSIHILLKTKDVLEEIVISKGYSFTKLRHNRGKGVFSLIFSVLKMELAMFRFLYNHKIDLLIGSTLSFVARIVFRINVLVFSEDDWFIVPKFAKLVYPFASSILSPYSCDNGKWEKKSVKYWGFQKLSYLHPSIFTPALDICNNFVRPNNYFFIIRLAQLNAHHDDNVGGLNEKFIDEIIIKLLSHGDVYVSSERTLDSKYNQFRLNIPPSEIHHVMANATLLIGDSQSMTVESAMLGVPSIRVNDFVGRIGVLNELEDSYSLTFGFRPSQKDEIIAKIDELLSTPNLSSIFQSRRQRMLDDKINVSDFFVWFIENYPESAKIMKENPDYQNRFK